MDKQILTDRIKKEDGVYIENKLKFTQKDEDETIHINSTENSMSGFILGISDLNDFYFANGFNLFDKENMKNFINFAKDLSNFLEVKLEIPGAETIDRVVKIKDETTEAKLDGKVEAYEKLLIGRTVSIGE